MPVVLTGSPLPLSPLSLGGTGSTGPHIGLYNISMESQGGLLRIPLNGLVSTHVPNWDLASALRLRGALRFVEQVRVALSQIDVLVSRMEARTRPLVGCSQVLDQSRLKPRIADSAETLYLGDGCGSCPHVRVGGMLPRGRQHAGKV